MTGRLADLEARIESVRTLGSVIRAMRGTAAARVHQTEGPLRAVDLHAATLAGALRQVMTLMPAMPASGSRRVTVLFLAEQGFVGAFSERLLDRAGSDLGELVVVGRRGAVVARERGLNPRLALALPSHPPAIPTFADRLAETLLAADADVAIEAIHAVATGADWTVVRRRVFPVPASPVPAGPIPAAPSPLTNLPAAELLADLLADCLHAELCRAALHAIAAENAARVQAMIAAQSQTDRRLDELSMGVRTLRQQATTAEILELASGEAAVRRPRSRPVP